MIEVGVEIGGMYGFADPGAVAKCFGNPP